ncbi:glucosaminidase domain-containing protein [Aquimarina sp. MMG015]|uniref:glucosaminidase domain-containing protein n=1 Tax=Aquimarina TaxID=290174 RepID=UPI00040430F9|nr:MULTISPECIES: glucosaminidase domain-containing protein [Aquimarina]AXT56593.1 LysM peptidoglycan-binding domain-containing protein [Aquimarina sp. AD1]MBQ4802600.1 glucosaminidase domain-containing protein [Aquimarina sp. MMG015]RKN33803.1 LysM peptidoglycan-binding domain-containing protein [Aquimarina sp. AD1]
MNVRRIITLFCIATFIVSCGGSKKATTSRRTKTASRKTEVKREVKEVKEEVVKPKKPLTTVSYKEKVQNYIFEYVGIAKHEMIQYGIPASITLAQGILESGAGYGDLTSKAKNHFGIKCHDWTGDRVYHDDDRSQECFRKYDEASHSFRDHSLFLKNRKRYAKLFTYKQDDYKSWAYGLRAAGYATDKKYPVKLISIIERYELDKYDAEVLGKLYTVTEKKKPNVRTTTKSKNGEYVVQKGDTLYSISRRYNLKVTELKAYNNLKDNAIAIGQVLKVQEPDDDSEEF